MILYLYKTDINLWHMTSLFINTKTSTTDDDIYFKDF